MALSPALTIGELARRTGLSVSAIRFYEEKGLVSAIRSSGSSRYQITAWWGVPSSPMVASVA